MTRKRRAELAGVYAHHCFGTGKRGKCVVIGEKAAEFLKEKQAL